MKVIRRANNMKKRLIKCKVMKPIDNIVAIKIRKMMLEQTDRVSLHTSTKGYGFTVSFCK